MSVKCGREMLVTLGAALILLLQGCGSQPPAPVDKRGEPPSQKINHHIVSKGETLFSIAWRYEKSREKLAAVNNLNSNYTIYPGQRLSLDTSRIPVKKAAPKPIAKPRAVPSQKTNLPKTAVTPKSPVTKTTRQSAQPSFNGRWSWPVNGKVSKRFSSHALFKGIDINALPGSPVRPAAPGKVVYAGSGLRGYGNLIIVRHNSIYLSAYAHNRRIYVKEGSAVKAGQRIAEVGGDPVNIRRFYFEIRKDGKPVNPLAYLPKK